jgi:ribosome-associated toxin RatA of RatAB toxin-antitoxin module
MASAEFHEVLPVDRDKLFAVITRYEDYPKFVDGCTKVTVERKAPGQARATYHITMMKDVVYTLDHVENPEKGEVSWKLVESDTFKKNEGHWKIKAAGEGKTDVYYTVDADFKIPVPSFILSRLVKGSLPAMMKGFEKMAKKQK